ncbi:MAG: PASTA domain-containing protein [Bacteroidetes bacterium]|nr:PASTA domain-containing protein [Bacteroidota bacterium]
MSLVSADIRKTFRFNLLIVILLCVVLYILFFSSLSLITRHGAETKVPMVTGRDIRMAIAELDKNGFDVEVDSAYDPAKKPFVVLDQMPEAASVVKNGRTVYLTINKADPPLTPMPNLQNLSFRSAEMILKSNKLILGDTTYRPDIAKGAILEQLYKGQQIRPGMMIPQGSRIDLVIGDGLGNTEMNVPDVVGMSYEEALAMLNGNGLIVTAIWEGEITDSALAVVYRQSPGAINELGSNNRIKEGDVVDISIMQNPSPDQLQKNKKPENPVSDIGMDQQPAEQPKNSDEEWK